MPLYSPDVGLDAYVPIQILPGFMRQQGSAALTNAAQSASAANSAVASGTASTVPSIIPIFAALLAVPGKTTRFKVGLEVDTNDVDPAVTFTVGLSLITAVAGTANAITYTWGNPVAGTTITIDPAVNALDFQTSPVFSTPADGKYALTLTMSGAIAATNPRVNIGMSLWMRHE